MIVSDMVKRKLVHPRNKEEIIDVLLRKHHHQYERHAHGRAGNGKITRTLSEIGRKLSNINVHGTDPKMDSFSGSPSSHPGESYPAEIVKSGSCQKFNEHFLKKIPQGAEVSNILVGELDCLSKPVMAFVRLRNAVLLGNLTEVPVPTRFMFILLGPSDQKTSFHEIGRSMATLMTDDVFHDVAYKAKNREDILSGIDELLDNVVVLPPGEWDPTIRIEPPKNVPSSEHRRKGGKPMPSHEPDKIFEDHADESLSRTGRFCGGLINDIKRKLPNYCSDIKDAFHIQCLSSIVFMYFACLTPIVTFGGLLGKVTHNDIAAIESLLAGAMCGVTYHLFAGQPLTIIGSTGPILVFEAIVYMVCEKMIINYLSFRFWIGIWVMIILLVMVAFDLSALVRYITRFTEECFASLIAIIFIYEAFASLIHISDNHSFDTTGNYDCVCRPAESWNKSLSSNVSGLSDTPVSLTESNCEHLGGRLDGSGCPGSPYEPDVFFFSCMLFIGTFGIAYTLKNFRNTRFFTSTVRILISDFAVTIAIVVMVTVNILVGVHTPKLAVPSELRPTNHQERGWFINPFINPWWCIPLGLIPALLATILIFMDQQITAVIVNRKEHKLKKGCGYHLDLLIIGLLIGICSMFGFPWFVAATVLSITHVRSLMKESSCSAPGERPKFLGVREQRVTGVVVFILIGASVFLSSVLKQIPMPVLYGVFLYMGVSSLKGIELVQRIMIVFMPAKYQPDYVYLRHVPLRRVNIFTFIQVLCLVVLVIVKKINMVNIAFPLMVLALCFIRKGLEYIFDNKDLRWLDDLMPESHKREKLYRLEEEQDNIDLTTGMVSIPLKSGETLNIPADKIDFSPLMSDLSSDTSIRFEDTKSIPETYKRRSSLAYRRQSTKDESEVTKPSLNVDSFA